MPMHTSLAPLPNSMFTPDHARHLLTRASFGATPAEIRAAHEHGLAKTVRQLLEPDHTADALPTLDLDPDVIRPRTKEENEAFRAAREAKDEDQLQTLREAENKRRQQDRRMFQELKRWWLQHMEQTPDPLTENMVLLWHGHFATRYQEVRDSYMMKLQQDRFRQYALGSFDRLAREMVRDPAMLKFLNNNQNRKGRPNENLAREFMELFTLGEGHYSERDIKEAARALTGYHVRDHDFAFRKWAHDPEDKTILGQVYEFNGDHLIRLLLRHRACSQYIALKLYRHYAADVPEYLDKVSRPQQQVIRAMAKMLVQNEYRIGPVVETLLMSRHFYDDMLIGTKIKSPVHLGIGLLRSTGAPARNYATFEQGLRLMGQEIFNPPSVAGWDGGRTWINTSTMMARQNLSTFVLTGMHPRRRKPTGEPFDPTALLAGTDLAEPPKGDAFSAKPFVDYFADAMLGARVGDDRRAPLVAMLQAHGKADAQGLNRLLVALTSLPEYQLA